MTFVLDAAAAIDGLLGTSEPHWSRFLAALERTGEELVAPDLLWSETTSVLHEQAWRGRMAPEVAADLVTLLVEMPIAVRRPRDLRRRAWEIADRMGWAKTYDAEYCALAELLRCTLVTTDGGLRAAGARLGYVATPAEAAAALA